MLMCVSVSGETRALSTLILISRGLSVCCAGPISTAMRRDGVFVMTACGRISCPSMVMRSVPGTSAGLTV